MFPLKNLACKGLNLVIIKLISKIDTLSSSSDTALRWMPHDLTNDTVKSLI